jgi:hypothetical protein
MAISFIEAKSGSANNGGNVTVNFTSAQSGDFVLVVGGFQDAGSNAGVSTAGYTELVELGLVNSTIISYKFITSDTGLTGLGTTQGSDGAAYVALVFRGVDTSNPIDNSFSSATGTGEPNSPSLTTLTDGAVVVSGFVLNESRTIAGSVGPSGYATVDGNYLVNTSDTNNVTVGATWKTISPAGAENPGAWNLSGVPSADVRGITVALRPADEGVISDGVASFGSIRGTASFVGNAESVLGATGTANVTFKGSGLFPTVAAFTGTGTPLFIGEGVTTNPVPFTMTGTGTALFVGALQGAGNLSAPGTASVTFKGAWPADAQASMGSNVTTMFIGAVDRLRHVREVIESRGKATVTMRV